MNESNPTPEPSGEQGQAKRYARLKLSLSLTETSLSLAAILILLLTPLSRQLADWVQTVTASGALQWLLFFGVIGAFFSLLGMIFGFVSGYVLEHRYGLSTQSIGGWLADQGKGMALGIAFGIPALLGFRWLLLNAGVYWGLATGVTAFLVTIVLARVTPTLLLPIFFKFKPVERTDLVDDLREICERGGLALEGVYQFDMSRQTKKANAAFTGFGTTKRIILGDTLLEKFPVEEIRAVVAHEVGHYARGHILKGMALSGVTLVLFFMAAQAVYGWLAPLLGYGPAGDLAGLPLIFLLLSIAGFLFQPVSNAISRMFEREADLYAFRDIGPRPMAGALRRLAEQNMAELQPHPVVEFFFHSHPAIAKRVAAAEAYTAS